MERMRIGLIAPPWFAVPPTGYGGIELVVSYLADGLVERGHDVTLFAAGGSRTTARLECSFAEPPSAKLGNVIVEAEHLVHAYSRWQDFDIIHDHTLVGMIAASSVPTPTVHTIHGPVIPEVAGVYQRAAGNVHLVAISEHQRSTLPGGVDATVIHNGIRPGEFPFSASHGEYLLFVGRINPETGVVQAIEIARRAGMPLVIVCKINEQPEREYWEQCVKPLLGGVDVEVREQPPQEEKLRYYRDAYATLFPIQWPEPFGLVMVESLATGTPVIAFRNGSVPEVIEDGRTGFIVDDVDGAVAALDRVPGIDRRACRDRIELLFSDALNVIRHEDLYRRILGGDTASAALAPHVQRPVTPTREEARHKRYPLLDGGIAGM